MRRFSLVVNPGDVIVTADELLIARVS